MKLEVGVNSAWLLDDNPLERQYSENRYGSPANYLFLATMAVIKALSLSLSLSLCSFYTAVKRISLCAKILSVIHCVLFFVGSTLIEIVRFQLHK